MENQFKLTVRTPAKECFNAEINALTVSTTDGEIQIFANHASLTGTISFSPLVIEESDKTTHNFLVRNGVIFFNNETNEAMILALYSEAKSEISYKTAQEYADFIEKELKKGKELSSFETDYLQGQKIAVTEQIEDLDNK
ncbi:hypothetical protein CVV38_03325 [Candidatus Peregrinibacteria bacterium HGW-Peregrinibacteria-1]|jgi:F-type H+-transporting ATPase subunit epsilon|nr:MAG: hypothetical protein CVV38_03325 [Candidatus Peregrinibacteria bacterium HGW-Peregrinibacteria-1]